MARGTIGLDIGSSAVRAAELRGKEPLTLARFAQLTLPPGAMVDGEIAQPDEVVAVIRDLWKRGEFRGKRVSIAVENQKVVVRQLELPKMDEQELRGALQFQVQDYIPIPIEEALLDFLILDEFMSEEGAQMMRVLTVAAQKEMIASFVDVVDRAGLEPIAVDLAPLAATRALVERIPSIVAEREAEAIVDVGAGVTSVVVNEHGLPRFVRIIQSGGGEITQSLVSELGLDPADAEARKIATGVQEAGKPAEGVAAVVERRVSAFAEEIRRSVEYHQQQPDAAPIARVLLTGGGARLARLAERLSNVLGKPVEHGEPLVHVQVGEIGLTAEQLDQVSAVAAVAIGLAMEA